ncbi:MAG: 16S rRNA (guanine(527)-N(7))-methyltransferase RsmG [Beggiatoa sp. IS2]|nr:MAG: 16S rRNA (guanine(527)-N(7))-methyltransferase RsmG [Beggiatoa sp. IS2]
MNLITNLEHGLNALQLELPVTVQQQLLAYLDLLAKWNRVYNLTAIREVEQMLPKHIFDSLAVLPHLHGEHILDIGTGAGVPGLILAMAHPMGHYVLLDSQAKKIRFVRQAIIELGITNVQVECIRIELFKPSIIFSTLITRAFSSLRDFYGQTRHLHTPESQLLAMKGIYPQTEIAEIVDLPVKITSLPLQIPQLSAQRHLIKISYDYTSR